MVSSTNPAAIACRAHEAPPAIVAVRLDGWGVAGVDSIGEELAGPSDVTVGEYQTSKDLFCSSVALSNAA